eukprot:1177208-Prorocentrum_minimum.AAC.2
MSCERRDADVNSSRDGVSTFWAATWVLPAATWVLQAEVRLAYNIQDFKQVRARGPGMNSNTQSRQSPENK